MFKVIWIFIYCKFNLIIFLMIKRLRMNKYFVKDRYGIGKMYLIFKNCWKKVVVKVYIKYNWFFFVNL